jgi:hypothetical protein
MVNAPAARPGHLSMFHRPDLYAESLDRRLGGLGLGSLGEGVESGVSVLDLGASTSFSSSRRM